MSACLLGVPCRYDGASKTCEAIIQLARMTIENGGLVRAVCPEAAAGLACPRQPVEIDANRRVIDRDGHDMTDAFKRGAGRTLQSVMAMRAEIVVFKDKSPSCGVSSVYDGSFSGTLVPGQGVAAQTLMQHGFHVVSDEDVKRRYEAR